VIYGGETYVDGTSGEGASAIADFRDREPLR
jgi:hypothetical protein